MYAPTAREQQLLALLGNCLRQVRIENNEYQSDFADRLGVSVPTYRKMEQGNAAVPIGYWIRALDLLNQLDEVTSRLPGLNECKLQDLKSGNGFGRQRARKSEKSTGKESKVD
jgi:transcriptional regulator with XRE-family HTH domain